MGKQSEANFPPSPPFAVVFRAGRDARVRASASPLIAFERPSEVFTCRVSYLVRTNPRYHFYPIPRTKSSKCALTASSSRSTFLRRKYAGQSSESHSRLPAPVPEPVAFSPPSLSVPAHPTPPPPPPHPRHTAPTRTDSRSSAAARHASVAAAVPGVLAHASHTTRDARVNAPHTAHTRER